MDEEHKECLNTSLLTGLDGRPWSKDFWRQGLSVKMELGRVRRMMQQTAALDALGEQKPLVREEGTRRAPWNVTVVGLPFGSPMGIGECKMSWMLQAAWHLETVKFVHLCSHEHKYLCCNYYFFFFFLS